ncbi:MAG: hypothetical protein P1U42_01630, partial [Phycisphaerales bacterium]|nr:hypothetical protein [Phycisphaerales bacterium]
MLVEYLVLPLLNYRHQSILMYQSYRLRLIVMGQHLQLVFLPQPKQFQQTKPTQLIQTYIFYT